MQSESITNNIDTSYTDYSTVQVNIFDMLSTNSSIQIHTATSEQVNVAGFEFIGFKFNNTDNYDIINQDILHPPSLNWSILPQGQLDKKRF